MTVRRRWTGVLIVAAMLAAQVVVAVQSDSDASGDRRSCAGADWSFAGGDLANSRYSTLDQIKSETIGDLGAARNMRFEGGTSTRRPGHQGRCHVNRR